jgi:hypothetical protein
MVELLIFVFSRLFRYIILPISALFSKSLSKSQTWREDVSIHAHLKSVYFEPNYVHLPGFIVAVMSRTLFSIIEMLASRASAVKTKTELVVQ